MTDTEKLEQLADTLRPNVDYRLELAILTVIDTLADVGDGHITLPCGDVGISITKNSIFLTNLNTGGIVFTLKAEVE